MWRYQYGRVEDRIRTITYSFPPSIYCSCNMLQDRVNLSYYNIHSLSCDIIIHYSIYPVNAAIKIGVVANVPVYIQSFM